MFRQSLRKSNIAINRRFVSTSAPAYRPPRHVPTQAINPQTTITLPLNKVPPPPQPPKHWRLQSSFPHVRYAGPIAYGIALSAGTFITAGVIFDKNQQTLWDRLRQHSRQWSFFGTANEESILSELWREKRDLLIEKRQRLLEGLARRLDDMSLPRDVKQAIWIVGEKLATMSEAEKTLTGLIAINTVVFACWQIPRLTPFMSKWFLHLPGSRQNITLLTSCFSHQEFFHFALNMVGLWSFGRVVHDTLGREQFVAMYLSAGIGANVVSHACSLALRNSRPLLPSLGASGAIYGLVASTAVLYPNSSISLIFLPMIPIKLGYALPALMSFDLAGIVFKWRMFDHYAHLAGAGLGLGYMYYGEKHIWEPLIRKIHQVRENSRGNGRGRGGEGGTFMWTEPRQPADTTSKWTGWFNK
ncbi:hypothetical protein FB192DRAFT_1379301 [Mucor lusitanicus]|uniref:Peptidase S54 rhomboid domain-containing protein n=2 Tax=Mucor circinelloides f. lusitanicus TaxID=29924 RepID=A0A8H4BIJ0_MUCCL|nr:hypothetical protein FB192DRAFT_1379301 [Mucor lusitanicus]